MRNFRLHTISHCDCDYRFKYCLLQLNDTVSTLVGMAFFNLLEIPCFTLEKVEQCVRWTWWGSCNGTGLVARAMLRSTFRYNYTHPLLDEIRLGWWPTTNLSGGSGSGLFSEMSPPVPVTHWQTPTTKSPKLKGKGRKKGRKGKGQRRKNLKAPSQNALETRLYVWSPGVRVETTGSPRISGSDSVTNRSAETVNMGVITTTIEGQQFTSKHNIPSTMSQREGSTPDTDQPLTHQPLTHQPLTHQPLTHQPLTHQPLTQQPLSQQPLTHQPLTQQPLTQQPLTQQPLTHQPSLTGAVGEIVSTINVRTESRVADLGERLLSSGFEEHSNSTPPTPAGHWGQVDNTGRPIPQRPGLTPNPPDKHGGYKRCGCYKRLDRCEHKIEPKQFKFYYHNLEPKTVYHCNCTKRLVKRMKKEGNPEALQAVLSDFVSLSCFYLKEPKGECSEEGRNLCVQPLSAVAVLSRARHLRRALKVRRAANESRYPALAEREGSRNGTRVINLYHKCLQAIQASRVKT
eukprot:gi/632967718/ref/XP_007900131.1/ PREDICTED: group 3 secretory phospholipase A2 [Callorhinchus milii]